MSIVPRTSLLVWTGTLVLVASALVLEDLESAPRDATVPAAPDPAAAKHQPRPGDGQPLVVHFAAPELELGARMLRETFVPGKAPDWNLNPDLITVHLDADEQRELFQKVFGQAGRLGTCVLDSHGEPLACLAGYASRPEVELLVERAASRLRAWVASDGDVWARARILVRLGTWSRGAQLLETHLARELSPHEEARARERLARCLLRLGRVAEGRAQLARWHELQGPASSPAVAISEALAALRSGETEVACGILEALWREHLAHAGRAQGQAPAAREGDALLLALGLARHKQEQGTGLEALGELLERYPRSLWRPEARRLIEHILLPPSSDEHTHLP